MATVCQNITSEQMDTPFTGASEKESHFCGILIEKVEFLSHILYRRNTPEVLLKPRCLDLYF